MAAEARRHLAYGITHAHDPYVPPSAHERMLALAGRTPLRLSWVTGPEDGIFDPPAGPGGAPEGPYGQAGREVKIFLDGADRCALRVPGTALPGMIGGTVRQALRRRAFGPIREGMGREMAFARGGITLPYLRFTDDELIRVLAGYAEAGFAVRVHALGNLAAEQAARALIQVRTPAVLDHLTGLDRRTADLIARSGARAAVQPGFVPRFGGQFAATGLDRYLAIAGARLLTESGTPPIFSSDHPCGPLDPLANLRVAVRRTLQPEQAIGRSEAVAAYTTRAAASIGAPGAGGIAPGEVADLAVCDGDPFDDATRVTGTWVAGRPH
ncbi:amidohydrolase family protein [Nonomuraea sp. NN258]|uniref:amidohydrolase family protein n=1 Tax=Nonomuraea antri TaxID=2730852 RepID=UPI00156A2756|nr:amidohydrolase family protein [Nonomuraea antri]NRQ40297.1 amidohydrolase family protein [Nonomuraea antri]